MLFEIVVRTPGLCCQATADLQQDCRLSFSPPSSLSTCYTLPPIFNFFSSCKPFLHYMAGTVHVCLPLLLLLLPNILGFSFSDPTSCVPPMNISGAKKILEAVEKSSPPLEAKIFECILIVKVSSWLSLLKNWLSSH